MECRACVAPLGLCRAVIGVGWTLLQVWAQGKQPTHQVASGAPCPLVRVSPAPHVPLCCSCPEVWVPSLPVPAPGCASHRSESGFRKRFVARLVLTGAWLPWQASPEAAGGCGSRPTSPSPSSLASPCPKPCPASQPHSWSSAVYVRQSLIYGR